MFGQRTVFYGMFTKIMSKHFLNNSGVGQALHDRTLTRRHLATQRAIDRIFSVRDGSNMNNGFLCNRSHIPSEFTEWPLNICFAWMYLTLNDNFGIGGNE